MGSLGSSKFDVWHDYRNVVNGELRSTTKTRHGINPASEKALPEVPVATPRDVDEAISAAQTAFESWSQVSWAERRKAVLAYADAVEKHGDDFAKLLTTEQGKPLVFAKAEIEAGVLWARTLGNMEIKEEIKQETDQKQVVVRYTPLGVCVGIVPWNFPILLALAKIAPALVTGNTILIKPSPFTPYGGLKLVELGQQFFPPGVLQVLSGDDDLGPWLTAHPGPAKISFTGSSATGKKVMESASKTLKRVTLELGGKDPTIICADVDVQKVAPKIVQMAFLNSGQICLAIKRIYIHESIYDEFLAAMVEHTKTLKTGDGMEEGNYMGPIQNSMQFEKVKGFFTDIEKDSLNVAVGGVNNEKPGYFITPTIIDRPGDSARIATDEPFGPIVPAMSWKDESEVIARANNTKMGLGASVWASNLETANRIARRIQAGTVWVNTHFELDPSAPFGGHKESGIGHEWGESGLKSFCNVQTLFLQK